MCPDKDCWCRSVVKMYTQTPICISKWHVWLLVVDTAFIAANIAMQLHTIITLVRLISNCLERLRVLTCLEAAQDKSRRVVQDTGLLLNSPAN